MRNTTRQKTWGLIAAVLVILFSLPLSLAQEGKPSPDLDKEVLSVQKGTGAWNLKDVDIRVLIQHVSRETGKNFVISPKVKGKVTLISNQSLSSEDLYRAFLSVLEVHGVAVVPSGSVYKIIPESEVHGTALPFADDSQSLDKKSDASVVSTIEIKHVPAKDLAKILAPYVSKSSKLDAYNPTNTIIVSDKEANIQRLEKLISVLDKPIDDTTEIIDIEYASAAHIASTVMSFESGNEGKVLPMTMTVDQRTNSILINGGEDRRLQIRSLISKLDIPTTNAVNVIYMKYIEASTIGPIIENIIQNFQKEGGKAGGSSSPTIKKTKTTTRTTSTRTGSRATSIPSTEAKKQTVKSSGTGGEAYVQWEEGTNALIVSAPPSIMREVNNVIARLDIRRPQVLVEVIIAEVNVSRLRALGIEWKDLSVSDGRNSTLELDTRLPLVGLSNILDSAGIVGGAGLVSSGPGLTLGLFRHDDIRGLLKALENESLANILSTPNIVTLDNEEATIKVGEKVSFAVGESNNDNTGGNPFTSFERQEVGLSLTLMPQITQSGAIKMKVDHTLSNVLPGRDGAGDNPTTSERLITTTVMVDDGETLILGGLIKTEEQEKISKVPLLGDIPLIKHFFRSKNRTMEKKNLMVFMRPVILRDDEDSVRVSGTKYDFLRKKQLHLETELDRNFSHEPRTTVLPMRAKRNALPPPFLGEES